MHMPERLNYKPFKSPGYSFLFHCLEQIFAYSWFITIKAMYPEYRTFKWQLGVAKGLLSWKFFPLMWSVTL